MNIWNEELRQLADYGRACVNEGDGDAYRKEIRRLQTSPSAPEKQKKLRRLFALEAKRKGKIL